MNYETGAGGVVVDVVVTALLWIASILQTAVLRDRNLPESPVADAARWLVMCGVLGLAVHFTYVLVTVGDLLVPPYSLLPLSLWAFGSIGLSFDRLRRPVNRRRVSDDLDLPTHLYSQVFGGHKP